MPASVPADPTNMTFASGSLLAACPLCASPRLHYAFSRGAYRVVRCADCRLMLLNPQPLGGERFAKAADPADLASCSRPIPSLPTRAGAATSSDWRAALHRYRGEIA